MLLATFNATCALCAVVLTKGLIVISGPKMSLRLLLSRSPLKVNVIRTPLKPHAREAIRSDYLLKNKQI